MSYGTIIEVATAPDLSVDTCGLPDHVTREQAEARVRDLYEQARDEYAAGRPKSADRLLYRKGQASGHYGLGSGKEAYPR